jgi:hypothetical protein
MSLINDALQRAKEAQRNVPPPPGPQLKLKPAEFDPGGGSGFNITLSAWVVLSLLFAFLVLGAVLLLENRRTVAAEALRPAAPAPLPVASPIIVPPAAPKPAALAPAPAPVPAVAPAPVPEPALAPTNASPAAAPTVQPKPHTPRLQAIFFNPNNPSAIIDGTTVSIGDRLGEFHVKAIRSDAVVLTGESATTVLTLE